MVTRYGFSKKLGNIVYGHDDQQTFLGRDYGQGKGYSERVANEIDDEVRDIVDRAYKMCEQILKDNIDKLHAVAKVLMEEEKINGVTFTAIMEGTCVEPKVIEKEENVVEIKENITTENEKVTEDVATDLAGNQED